MCFDQPEGQAPSKQTLAAYIKHIFDVEGSTLKTHQPKVTVAGAGKAKGDEEESLGRTTDFTGLAMCWCCW